MFFVEDLANELWGIDFKAWAEQISDANAKLTADINVNPGITITESTNSATVRHWTPIGTNYYNAFKALA